MAKLAEVKKAAPEARKTASKDVVRELSANELVFAVVGPVGSGTTEVAESLHTLLSKCGYETKCLKARDVIASWAVKNEHPIPNTPELEISKALQNAGDAMREKTGDYAAVALALIQQIRVTRAKLMGVSLKRGVPIEPDGRPRAFILDSLRHHHEVALLRRIYQDSFCLIGVVCYEDERYRRLCEEKYSHASRNDISDFMRRDENAPEKHGQKVAETFQLADFYVDNTTRRFQVKGGKKEENPDWGVPEQLGRLVDILTHKKIIRPRPNETGMFHANGARMRSSCLSRQVGAALMDRGGNVIATGTNEVPRAGGGVYGGVFLRDSDQDPAPNDDFRCCVHHENCSNTIEQNNIIQELLKEIDEFKTINPTEDLIRRIRKNKIGQLIEFSRAVHAEMDALMSAARQGISPVGSRLFVTTYPCHNCARHIVAAGVDEVQFIEPYLKSKAIALHGDAITTDPKDWTPPSMTENVGMPPRVLFQPFTGVAPRLYRRAFYKDRDLKDSFTGQMLREFDRPDGYTTWETLRVSYSQVEAHLEGEATDGEDMQNDAS